MSTKVTFDDIVNYLKKEGWSFGIGSGDNIKMNLKGKTGLFSVYVSFRREKEIITMYIEHPSVIPENFRDDIGRFVNAINWGLHFGTCEVNNETGKVRFRSFMLIDDAPFIEAQFATMLATLFSIAEKYGIALNSVIEGKKSAEEAIKEVEII